MGVVALSTTIEFYGPVWFSFFLTSFLRIWL
jgi:hypothetical protein